jgi:hypothetical protein
MSENTKNNVAKVSEALGRAIGSFGGVLLSALFIYWGWGVLAPHLNAPEFTYWEIAGIRFAVGTIIKMLKR